MFIWCMLASASHPPHRLPLPCAAASAQTTTTPSFPTFFDALSGLPNTNYGKEIVASLKLQSTLSNPKLALTVFMPEDKVGISHGLRVGVVTSPSGSFSR